MKTNIEVLTCDRCNATEEFRHDARPDLWGRVTARRNDGDRPTMIGDMEKAEDLCPKCFSTLIAWYRRKRSV